MIRMDVPAFGRSKIRIAGVIGCPCQGLFRAVFLSLLCVAVGALGALGPHVCRAQTPGTGAISGIVLDPSGAAVGNAKITIAEEEIQIERSATTAADGSFRLNLLPIGAYSITVNE